MRTYAATYLASLGAAPETEVTQVVEATGIMKALVQARVELTKLGYRTGAPLSIKDLTAQSYAGWLFTGAT